MPLPDLQTITHDDVLAVIDARGGVAFIGSVITGLTNRVPLASPNAPQRAVARALAQGVVVETPPGQLRRPPAPQS